ncbi:MAG: transketolase C-terminal domain-containing protein, partial [Brevefilum sp.]
GTMSQRSLATALKLSQEGIDAGVFVMSCIKPIDEALIVEAAQQSGAIVTAEEHSILGGLGSAVAEVLTAHHPGVLERVGIRDTFAKTGPDPESLMDACGLSVNDIIQACKKAMTRKKK